MEVRARATNPGDEKSHSMSHFKGDTIAAWRLLVHTKHEEIYGQQSLHSHPVLTAPAFDGVVLRKYVG